jgi:c-di-GMP-binding flagellar brake protein YcgR
MVTQSMTRRSKQLALLHEACRQPAAAVVCRRRPAGQAGPPHNTRLLELAADGLWLAWPDNTKSAAFPDGASVQLSFELNGLRYRCPSIARGRQVREVEYLGPVAALQLDVPLRVTVDDPAERRVFERLDAMAVGPLMVQLVHLTNKNRATTGRLTDISLGGFGAELEPAALAQIDDQALFWVGLELEPTDRPLDFIARLTHRRGAGTTGGVQTGWEFCAADDDTTYRRNLRRLRDYVAQQSAADE